MARSDILGSIVPITVPDVSDIIIEQIRDLVSKGVIKPGDRLPSESNLARTFGVKRGKVREALRRMELFGVLKTSPQSGTYVNGFGCKTVNGILSNILKEQKGDYLSLLDTRRILEQHAAMLAARTADEGEIQELEKAHQELKSDIERGGRALDENIFFHLKIAELSHSPYLISQITILSPEIIDFAVALDAYLGVRKERFERVIRDHTAILDAIKSHKPEEASRLVSAHIESASERAKELKNTHKEV